MADPDLPLTVEVPWRLASTTQPLAASAPDQTTISLFVFEPDDADLTSQFADERIVLLKFTVSISPATIPGLPPQSALGEGVPCYYLRLDARVSNSSGEPGTIRPYFHTAAPLHRTMLQTGIVGAEAFEGESDELSIGRSGSQMYESSSSQARTTSAGLNAGFGIGPFSIGGSVRTTGTDINASRAVTQQIDTTQRDASEERRELLSHMTKVENILSLLDAKYVGTPHLRFSLAPRPLQLLSLDPTDPNLWFSQLLARRSSGIEGVQEFSAVVLVPKGEGFCVATSLRRVCVLDSPPGPLSFAERFVFNQHIGRLLGYLNRVYPRGTPLDELDVDLTGALPNPQEFARPVVEQWVVSATGFMLAAVVSHRAGPTNNFNLLRALAGYKHLLEIWLEVLRDEYEQAVAQSPLERGILIGEVRTLETCFTPAELGFTVTEVTASVTPLARIVVSPALVDLGGVQAAASRRRDSTRERAYETVTRWNLLEGRLAVLLGNREDSPTREISFSDYDLLQLVLDRWSKLEVDDETNCSLDQLVKSLGLNAALRGCIKAAGVVDLRSLAQTILAIPEVEQYNRQLNSLRSAMKVTKRSDTFPETVPSVLSLGDKAKLEKAICNFLSGSPPPQKKRRK